MAISEHFEPLAGQSTVTGEHRSARWSSAEMYVLIIGLAAVAALAIARLVFEPSFQERSEAARLAIASEHMSICNKLGKAAGTPDYDNCLKLLDGLQATHQRAVLGDSGEI